MNIVEIKHTYLNHQAILYINQEEISTYGNLSSLMKRPFHVWAPNLISALDQEIGDLYRMELTGTFFQYKVLEEEAKRSTYCSGILFHQSSSIYPVEWIQQRLIQLCLNHGIQTEQSLPVYVYSEIEKLSIDGYLEVRREMAQLCLLTNEEDDLNRINRDTAIVVQDSEQAPTVKDDGSHAVYLIPSLFVDHFLEFYRLYHVTIPCIENCLQALKYCRLEEIEKTELQSIVTGRASYYFGSLPEQIDEGDSYDVCFISFPSGVFKIFSSDPDTVSFKDGKLTAKKSGKASISIHNQDGSVLETREVEVISHNYAREIHFITDLQAMTLYSRQKLEIAVLPADAEDLDELVWSVEPFSAAQITDEGEITALQSGIVKVIVTGKRTSAVHKINIQVDPVRIQIEPPSIQIAKGEERIVSCLITPEGAATGDLSWSFDNPDIAMINPSLDGTRCKLITTGRHSGSGNIKCCSSSQGIAAICNVTVRDNHADKFFSMIALALIILGVFWSPLMIGAAVVSGYGLYINWKKEKLGTYWFCLIVSIILSFIWLRQ